MDPITLLRKLMKFDSTLDDYDIVVLTCEELFRAQAELHSLKSIPCNHTVSGSFNLEDK